MFSGTKNHFNLVKDIYESNPEFTFSSKSDLISSSSTCFTSKDGVLHVGTGSGLENTPKAFIELLKGRVLPELV